MYQDRPNFKVFELGNTAFYQGHPLGNSILGSEASIKALSQEQMLAYFKKRYVPNNMILTLAGNFDWAEVTEQVTSLTESWNAAELTRAFPATQTRTGTAKQLDPNLKRAHVAIFAPGVSAQSDLRYAAALIGSCLGDSSGSRLYWALVDKGLVDSASLSHDSSDQSGAYLGYLSSAPEQLEQVLSIFDQELFKVENEGLDQAEWLRAQRKLATSITLRAETPYGRLMMLGSSYLYNRQYQTVDEVVQAVFSASLSDAKMLLAQKPFSQRFAMILNQAG